MEKAGGLTYSHLSLHDIARKPNLTALWVTIQSKCVKSHIYVQVNSVTFFRFYFLNL